MVTVSASIVLVSHIAPLDQGYSGVAVWYGAGIRAQGPSASEAAEQAQASLYGSVQQHSAMLAFIDDFQLFGWLCLAIIPLALGMKSLCRSRGG